MLSASSLSRAKACPASEAYPHVNAVPSDEASRGTACHKFLEIWIAQGYAAALAYATTTEIEAYLKRLQPLAMRATLLTEVAFAMDATTGECRRLGSGLSRDYPVTDVDVPGTQDIGTVIEDAWYCGDWKFGIQAGLAPASENLQVRFLGAVGAKVYGKPRAIVEVIPFDDDGVDHPSTHEMDRMEMDAVLHEVRGIWRKVQDAKKVEKPSVTEGPHCKWCPAWEACPAKTSTLITLAQSPETAVTAALQFLTPENAERAYQIRRRIKDEVKRMDLKFLAYAKEHGAIRTGNGTKVWGFRPKKNRSIIAEKARDVLPASVYEASATMKITQDALGDAIGSHGKALEELMEKLEAAGAVTVKETEEPGEYEP